MAIDSSKILDVAKVLAAYALDTKLPEQVREAFLRALISRTYYAVYHSALRWAKMRGYKRIGGISSHECLWKCWFDEPETLDIQTLGSGLLAKRNLCDYKLDAKVPYGVEDVFEEAG